MKLINLRVSDAEHVTMRAIAGAECMTLSAYIRRHFTLEARRLGLVPDPLAAHRGASTPPPTTAMPAKPAPTPVSDDDYQKPTKIMYAQDMPEIDWDNV